MKTDASGRLRGSLVDARSGESMRVGLACAPDHRGLDLTIDEESFELKLSRRWESLPPDKEIERAVTRWEATTSTTVKWESVELVVDCGATPPYFGITVTSTGDGTLWDWSFEITHEVQHQVKSLIDSVWENQDKACPTVFSRAS